MRLSSLVLAASLGAILSGAAQAQSTMPGGTGGTGGSSGNPGSVSGGSATTGSPGSLGSAGPASGTASPGMGAARSPNAAPIPSAGRPIAPGATGSGSTSSGAPAR